MIDKENRLYIAHGENPIYLLSKMANKHGLIAGATGTGKTVTLQVIAESLSSIGVPVFMSDVKGDLSGLSTPGKENKIIKKRIAEFNLTDYNYHGFPIRLWDVFGEKGHPVRTTVSEMGPLLLARLLDLNPTQTGVLNIVFRIADESGMLLLDLKDLRAMLNFVGENADDYTTDYGNVSKASIGAIQRGLLVLEDEGGTKFFGEPALDIFDLMQHAPDGRGIINILSADKLMHSPSVYATFLLWLLSELFEQLPEVGDPDKPKLVFFFDEAHLMFDEAPKALLKKIEQVVRLIRSKGVGVFFVTQNPLDIPDDVLGQLGNRVQHALRAFTRRDQKAVRAAAETFRENPKFDTEEMITQMGVGEALVSLLNEKGAPSVVEAAKVLPPESRIGPIDESDVKEIIKNSAIFGKYEKAVDRESAFEILKEKAEKRKKAEAELQKHEAKYDYDAPRRKTRKKKSSKGLGYWAYKTANSRVGKQLGREIVRGILGGIFGTGSKR